MDRPCAASIFKEHCARCLLPPMDEAETRSGGIIPCFDYLVNKELWQLAPPIPEGGKDFA